ncbi:MAG: tetratricopeptide repeat protein [Dyadobacter sp.]|uniref:tetratricopeptide repeat protein n=1 Tax=Dyadobacter sp. TaxID=1914288 RepID=UPI003264DA43
MKIKKTFKPLVVQKSYACFLLLILMFSAAFKNVPTRISLRHNSLSTELQNRQIISAPKVNISGLLDTLSQKDNNEVKLLAKRKVEKGLNDLLNTIIFEDLGTFERKAIMADSYGNSPNKVFYDDKVIIEDDLNPEFTSAANTTDLLVNKYLNNFDLFYPKSIDRTIYFSDFKVSDLKKSEYYYVKVYFKSHFKGQHVQINMPYQPTQRVAEIRAEKTGKKWTTYISQVAFYAEKDSVNSLLNNVVIIADTIPNVSDQPIAALSSEVEIGRQKERESEIKAQEVYNQWLTSGDQAFATGDFEKALEAYTEAEKLNVYEDLLPRRKIYQVKRAFEKGKQTQAELISQYLAKASIAEKKRNYKEAITYYKKVQDAKPDSTALRETIKLLNQKSSVKTELDEKYNSGKYAEVIKDYSRILKIEKDNSDYYLGRGLAYVMNDDIDKALKDFNKAIELDYANLAALRARIELFTIKKDYPKAIADLTSYLNIDNTSNEMLTKRAKLRIMTRNTPGAFEDYNQAVQLAPGNALYYHNRGLLYFDSNELSTAVLDFSSAIERDTQMAESYYYRGLCQVKLHKIPDAGNDFARLRKLAMTPNQDEQISTIALSFFKEGNNRLTTMEFSTAIEQFNNAIHIKPTISDFWFQKARGHLYAGDSTSALESFQAAIHHNAQFAEAFLERAKLWFSLGKYEKAATDFNRSYQISSVLYEANAGEGNAYFELKQYEKAAAAFEFIRLNEKKISSGLSDSLFAMVYNRLGLSYFAIHQNEKAIEEYGRAINKRASHPEAFFNRGEAYVAAGNLKKAINDYRQASILSQKNPLHFFKLGQALENDKRFDDAITAFSEAIKLDTNNICCLYPAMVERADNYFSLNRFSEAITDYTDAFKMDTATKSPAALLNAGTALIKTNRPAEAIKTISQINSRDEMRGQVNYVMACAFVQQRRPDEALKWFEKSFTTGLITKAYLRKDKLLDGIDKAFSNTAAFKELVNRNIVR